MKQLVHGGDWMSYRERFGRDVLDFSANVSPLGLPEGVAQAIREALAEADRYPDPLCRTLRAALSRAEGVPPEQILCGNGAADLIFRLVWAAKPRRALVTAPTFAEYAAALDTAGCEVKRFFLGEAEDFAVTDALVDAVDESTDMVFLCQPNNPTGQLASPGLVEKLLRRCEACGAILAVDECFLDFLPDCKTSAARVLDSRHLQGLYQALRHGRRPAGLLPLRRRGAFREDAGSGSAVGRVESGAGGGHRGFKGDGLCG